MPRTKTFDSNCHDLAELFLSDAPRRIRSPEHVTDLAAYIQRCIEEWIEDAKSNEWDNSA